MLLLLILLLVTACGVMKIQERHYYAIENNDNTNIFRLVVQADTVLGEAKYNSGWYPANAVDSLYGNVRSYGGQADLQARQEIETEVRKGIVQATKNYNIVALNPASTDEDIQRAMQVRRNVLSYPSLWTGLSENSRIIDYNPSEGVVIKHSDEKMVIVLSSNPDVVIGNIKNFAESDKTALAVSRLAKVTSQRVRNEIVADEAKEAIVRKAIETQLNDSITLLENADASDKDKIQDQIKLLIEFFEGVN
jgi:hypothetical protein